MRVTEDQVQDVAKLARLTFSSAEQMQLAQQLSLILDYANKLNELDTEHVQPMIQVFCSSNVFREDNVKSGLTQEEALSNAIHKFEGYFQVPAVLD